ncbi:MAG TPA: 4-hydroxy-tetrahydrodipicolinate reductase [Gammaproteobacteria bacterium]|nr:4-hydroxy-tetrahydrodipicolinate reductase [Gammaproteobacteria bacterium]
MAIRVIVNGAHGKMGQPCVRAIESDPDLILSGESGRQDDLAALIQKHQADVVVDLTNAESVLQNLHTIIEAGARPVIGTTGLLKEQISLVQKKCQTLQRGGVIAPNFALGAVLMMKYAREMARYFSTVEIIELHHDRKIDSPSGTAIRSAEMISETLAPLPSSHQPLTTKETLKGARGAHYERIPIHAVRLPGLLAEEQIIFGGTGETLTLKHSVIDRSCFMPGILLACKKVMELHELVYGLENMV